MKRMQRPFSKESAGPMLFHNPMTIALWQFNEIAGQPLISSILENLQTAQTTRRTKPAGPVGGSNGLHR